MSCSKKKWGEYFVWRNYVSAGDNKIMILFISFEEENIGLVLAFWVETVFKMYIKLEYKWSLVEVLWR